MPIKKRTWKDGKAVYDVRAEYDAIRIQKTVPTTYTEAKRVESRLLQDLIGGRYEILRSRQNPYFSDYAKEYREAVTWQKSFERTCRLIKHLIAYFGNKKLTEITVSDFINYRTLRLKTVKPATVNREYACLKRMLNIAVKSDDFKITKNPLRDIPALKEKPSENRILSLEEYHKLLDAAPEYFRRIIDFACNTAMRRTEIMSLRFGQIKVWTKGMEIELTDTKSGERETVLLNRNTMNLILEIASERKINVFNMTDKEAAEYVFLGKYGKPLADFRYPMKLTFARAGIHYRPFHTFRHFWTSQMFNAGVDVAKIKKISRVERLENDATVLPFKQVRRTGCDRKLFGTSQ